MQGDIAINLGVDFGTRFTKICAFSDEIGTVVVDFGEDGLDNAIVPSFVTIDDAGTVMAALPGEETTSRNSIAHLKMALADRGALSVDPSLSLPVNADDSVARAISAFFLASTIKLAKAWVASAWKDHIGNRSVEWSGNVGLPVEYIDSNVRPVFQEVIAVAWNWAETGIPQGTIADLIRDYDACEALNSPEMSFCQTYPEIAAAVMSFANSRSSAPGIYVYFDIGGGTVDGVVFNLRRPLGEVHIDFYSGHVQSLGVDWVVDKVAQNLSRDGHQNCNKALLKTELMTGIHKTSPSVFQGFSRGVSRLAGKVVYEGKRKDKRDWRKAGIQDFGSQRTLRKWALDEALKPLKVFVGGGGSSSNFYQTAITDAYDRNTLRNFGVPPFELIEVPAPADLFMGSVAPSEYHRFLVAYGLSVPFGEGPEIRLPSQFKRVAPAKVSNKSTLPDYSDHKAIFD